MDYSQVSDTEYKTDASDSQSLPSARPGRFDGPQSTWRTFNEDEITLADSLIQLQAEDLSAHLYNAHAMKQRLYDPKLMKGLKPWASKDRWRPEAKEGEIDDGANFVPPDKWTAWPLEPEIVPRAGEQREKDDEVFKLRTGPERPSKELEEVLTAVALKFAKETFEEREWETEEEGSEDGGGESTDEGGDTYKPIVSADDERSARLLRPTIRHTLTRLDSLLHALHVSRKACMRYDADDDGESLANLSTTEDPFTEPTTEIETDIDMDTSNPPSPKRGVGRPRRIIEYPLDHQVTTSPPKKSNRGRKKKVHLPREGETQAEMMVRIAREQHRALPFGSSSPAQRGRSRSVSQSRGRSGRGKRPRSASTQKGESRSSSRGSSGGKGPRLGLRDWSEVLGTAALVGFPPDVLDRTAKRCALLFGEGMTMRVLTEGIAGGEHKEVMYAPDKIPDFDALSAAALKHPAKHRSVRSTGASSRATSRSRTRRESPGPDDKSGYEDLELFAEYCPVQDCERRTRGFKNGRALRSHLRLGHKMETAEVETALAGDGAEMDGGVHNDGFGRMITRKVGWRAGDVGSRRREDVAARD